MRQGVWAVVLVGAGLAGAAGAQVLGQGEEGRPEAGPGRRDVIDPAPSAPPARPGPGAGDAGYQVFRRGEAPAGSMPVLRPGETFHVRFPTLTETDLEVEFEAPSGALALRAARGEGGAELTGNVDDLVDPRVGASRGHFAVKSNPGGSDAEAFHAELVARAGAGGTLPARDLGFLDGSGALPYPGREVLEGGGVRQIPLTARDPEGRLRARGKVAVAARSSWLYYAGHYTSGGVGGRLAGDPVTPAAIEGTQWRDHLEVLVLAACSAGKTGDSSREGADWWLKFEGTLLAYRGTAPTRAAPEIATRLLAKVAAAGVRPEDPVAYSVAVARAWMEANLEVGNQMAVAFDRRGSYYLHQTWSSGLPAPEAGEGSFWKNVGSAFARNLPRMVTSRLMGERYWVVERKDWECAVPPATD